MDLKHYLIISNICLVISFILFRILNRDETMFRQRRIFILLSVLLSLLLPLSGLRISLPQETGSMPVYNSIGDTINSNIPIIGPAADKISNVSILYFYFIISAIIVLNIIVQLARVFWFYLLSDKKDGYVIKVTSHKLKSPFSFFRWIFIPWTQDKQEDLESIIIHESVHGRQLHTFDNIILEIASALMWFNPFIWIMKRDLHLLHEYLADEGTLKSGIEKITYQSLLINHVAQEKLIVIPSSFNNNNLKKRIIMMTQNKKEGHNGLVRRKLIPLSILILAVSILQGFYPVNVKAQNSQQQTKQQVQVRESKSKDVVVIGYGQPDTTAKVKIRAAKENVQDNPLFIIDDKESTKADFENLDPENIESMSVLKGESMKAFTTKDYDGIIVIETKGNTGKVGSIKSMNSVVVTRYAIRDSLDSVGDVAFQIMAADSDLKNSLSIVDEKEMSREEFERSNPEKIKSVTVIKDKDQQKIYTKKDYDGVMVVTTKK